MKNITWLGIALVFLLVFPGCEKESFEQPAESTLPKAITERLNVVLDSVCRSMDLQGASVAVLIPGKGLWQKAYGFSHKGTPISTKMALTIGSNTKTYIATLMLKLQEQGKLSLNDTIGRWIPDAPFVNGQITIRQLLNHTSGMGDFTFSEAFIDAIKADFYRVWKPEEAFPYFQPPYFSPPGSGFAYSDQNTVVAGLVIQAVTGQPVEKSLRALILDPAGLPQTVYYPFENTKLTIPHSWSADYNEAGKLEDLDATYGYSRIAFCSADNAAGGMLSTAEENARFWHELMSGRIISQASLSEMKEMADTGIPDYYYGLCVEKKIHPVDGRILYAHNGYVPGSINDNLYDERSGVVITVLTNQDKFRHLSPVIDALHRVAIGFP